MPSPATVRKNLVWAPQEGPQAALVECPAKDIFYGGARGGGKTDGMLGKNLIKSLRYPGKQHGIFFRRELTQLENAISRAHQIYGRAGMGWTWHEQKKLYTSPCGNTLKFAYLDKDRDAEMYQGWSLTDAYFEELTNFPSPKPYDKAWGFLRSVAGVPTQRHATGNPGGAGHNWVKERFIDPNPNGWEILWEVLPNGDKVNRIFIPSKVSDNALLMENDPFYIQNLYMSGNEEVVRAWLEGDWNVIEGAYFKNWSPQMVIEPFAIPDHWMKFRSFDWGSAKPFSCGWWAIASEDYVNGGQFLPKGAMIRYRELYGAKSANIGLNLTASECGERIKGLQREGEHITYSVADPSIFVEDGGPSLNDRMGGGWYPADNARVQGWNMMNERMRGQKLYHEASGEVRKYPMIYCFNTCKDSIRTIPILQHDEKNIEDLDTEGEDHVADEWRYGCMSRPWIAPRPEEQKPKDRWDRVFDTEEEETWRTL